MEYQSPLEPVRLGGIHCALESPGVASAWIATESYGVESAVLAVNTKMRCGEPVATLITPYERYPELTAD